MHKEGSGSYRFSVNVSIWLQFTSDILVCINLTITLGRIWYHYFLSQICISICFTWTRPFFTAIAVFGWDKGLWIETQFGSQAYLGYVTPVIKEYRMFNIIGFAFGFIRVRLQHTASWSEMPGITSALLIDWEN